MMQKYTLDFVKQQADKKLFSVISLFAGGGGSSTGYKLAGGDVLVVNEFVEEAVKTYSENYPGTNIICDDVKKITGEDLLNIAKIGCEELDILDGSPPCSAFSVAGKRDKNWKNAVKHTSESYFDIETLDVISNTTTKVNDGVKKYSDNKIVEGIEDLFLEYIRIASEIKPKIIIAENVKGLIMGAARQKLIQFQNLFSNIVPGYIVTHFVLNASDFDTAQSRERLFIVCIRSDVADIVGVDVLNINSKVKPKSIDKIISIKDAIDDVENDPIEEQMLLDFVEKSFQKKFIEMLSFNPNKHTKPSDIEFIKMNPKRSCFNMIRPAIQLPCPTLTQAGQKMGLSGVFHYAKNRKLTIKELKILMGLPDDYILTGTFDQKAERICRMVAPRVLYYLAQNIYNNIILPYREKIK